MKAEITEINPGATQSYVRTNLFVYVTLGDERYQLHFWDGPMTYVVTCRGKDSVRTHAIAAFARSEVNDNVRTDELRGLDLLSKLGVRVDADKQEIHFTGHRA